MVSDRPRMFLTRKRDLRETANACWGRIVAESARVALIRFRKNNNMWSKQKQREYYICPVKMRCAMPDLVAYVCLNNCYTKT